MLLSESIILTAFAGLFLFAGLYVWLSSSKVETIRDLYPKLGKKERRKARGKDLQYYGLEKI